MLITKVARHALTRFQQRVDATVYEPRVLLNLWAGGTKASNQTIIERFDRRVREDSEYRICIHKEREVLIIATNGAIVSVAVENFAPDDIYLWKLSQRRG